MRLLETSWGISGAFWEHFGKLFWETLSGTFSGPHFWGGLVASLCVTRPGFVMGSFSVTMFGQLSREAYLGGISDVSQISWTGKQYWKAFLRSFQFFWEFFHGELSWEAFLGGISGKLSWETFANSVA